MPKHKFTRIELHELLWKKSTTQVAKELDIKASHIRKICKHYDIPLPKSGYWSKIAFNKEVNIQGLYNLERFKSDIIDLKEPFEDERDHYQTKLSKRTKEIELQFPSAVKVKERLSISDPLVKEARTNLVSKKSYSWRGVTSNVSTSSNFLSIEVTKANISRALRIFDCLINLIRLRGHQLGVNNRGTFITVKEQTYHIRLREKGNRVITDPESSYPTTAVKPNGKLSIKLDRAYSTTEWVDGSKKLEEQMARIVAAFELKAERDIEEEKERAIRRVATEKRMRIEAENNARIRWNEGKKDILLKQSTQWHQAQSLNQFISEVEKNTTLTEEQIIWTKWARAVVDELNPLAEGLNNLIDKYDFKHSNFHK